MLHFSSQNKPHADAVCITISYLTYQGVRAYIKLETVGWTEDTSKI